MENKRELFDLKAEKRELDAFLSTVAETAASLPVKDVVQTKETLSSLGENKSTKPAPGKKTDEASLYDCEPEKKSAGRSDSKNKDYKRESKFGKKDKKKYSR